HSFFHSFIHPFIQQQRLFLGWWSAVKYHLDRALWVVTAKDDGRSDAIHPGAFAQRDYARFMALEPAMRAFGRFENEGFKIAEVIVDDCVDLPAERWR